MASGRVATVFFPDGRTLLLQVSCLARGSLIEFGARDRSQPIAYWFPRLGLVAEAVTQQSSWITREPLRELLLSKLDRDLQAEGGNLLTMSGGVDSASVAALARGVLNRPIMTWSLLPEPADLYEQEMSFIQPLRDQYGFERIGR
jgi:asparagine synthetase B (glutamine-hydrolysing)